MPCPRRLRRALCTSLVTQRPRSEEHTSELQSLRHLVCRLLLEKKKTTAPTIERSTTTDNICRQMQPPPATSAVPRANNNQRNEARKRNTVDKHALCTHSTTTQR